MMTTTNKRVLAIWAHPYEDFTPAGVADETLRLFETLAGVNVTMYLPFLAEGPDAYYRTARLDTKHDYLTPILAAASRFGIEVHPLFGFGRLAGVAEGRTYQAQVPDGKDWMYPVGKSVCASWKENQESLVALIAEIVDEYAIDGIQLDYFRYPNMTFEADYPCECNACQERRKPWLGHGCLTVDDRRNPAIMHLEIQQKAANIYGTLQRISAVMTQVGKPLCLAARARYIKDAVYEGQDWRQFAHEGFFNTICPMSYNQCSDRFTRFLDEHQRILSGAPVKWLPGVGKKSSLSDLTTAAFMQQMEMVLERPTDGACIFSYKGMTADDFAALQGIKDAFVAPMPN